MHPRIYQRGITLIELLLYIALVGSLLLGVTAFFGLAIESRVKNQTIAEVDQQGGYVMDYVTQTVRNATAISSPAAAASTASLSVTVPTSSLSPTVFSLSGTSLQVVEGSGSAVLLTNNTVTVTNLTFTNLTRSGTNGLVRISFTITRVNNLNRNQFDYSKTFTSSAEVRW